MKSLKRIISIVLICVMVIPLGIFTVSAETPELTNWRTMAGKYSASTYAIIAPKSNDYKIKTDGYTFTENEGGVSVHTPTYAEFAGAYGASAITSKATTPLDGLTVVIEPEEFDFTIDSNGASNTLGILWTEEPIEKIAGFNEAKKSYDTGLSDAVMAYASGLRHLIPVVEGATHGVPAAKANTINGKALYISVTNRYGEYDGSKTASNVNIVYYDGSYINQNDGHPGYRWTFTARNSPQTALGDSSGVSSRFMEIDLTYGLVVNVRADADHGYIVNINGTDYYKGTRKAGDDISTPIVGFYPDANVDGTSHTVLTNEDYVNKTDKFLNSMTFARNDIDLTGLREAGEGYLTVGAVSINDRYLPDHGCDYTVSYINTVPAAEWKGETFPADHVHEYDSETIDATCTEGGAIVYRCGCGNVYSDRIVALGHDMVLDTEKSYDPTCTEEGYAVKNCSRCSHHTEESVVYLGHDPDDWYVSTVATPEANGTKSRDCTRCDYIETKSYTYSGLDDVVEDWEITATNGMSGVPGMEEVPMVDAEVNEDGSILVKDYSLMTGLNASYNTVTKAINKNKTSLNGFTATVTPVALNENFPDLYPETLSFTLTNAYDKYNYATEYSAGTATKNLPKYYAGVPSNEVYRYGNIWGDPLSTDMLKEYTVSFTLMDYLPLNGNPMGTPDDGYYDVVFWSVRSGGNHWCDKVVYLDFPIKMGNPVELQTFYEFDPDTGNTHLSAGFNIDLKNYANIFDMGVVLNSQSEDAIYSFVVAAHSPILANPDNSAESLSASSFVINSICGESAVDFDGYEMSSHYNDNWTEVLPLDPPHTHEDVTNNKWVVVKKSACGEDGIKAQYCTLCGEPVNTEAIAADGDHTPGEWITVKDPACGVEGLKELHCSVCDKVIDTDSIPPQHVYTEDILIVPTCTEEGMALMVCSCSNYYIATLPTVDHQFTDYTYNTTFPCMPAETMTAYCDYGCGSVDVIASSGGAAEKSHIFSDYTYNEDATCVDDGTMTAYCDYGCGTAKTIIAYGTKLPHEYTEIVTKAPTCTATGIMTYTCKHCGNSYTETLDVTDHNYVPDVIKEATCISTGMTLYMCSCSNYYIETTPKTDHKWNDWSVTVAPTVNTKGEEERSCSVCSATETREIDVLPKPEFSVDNYVVTITNADYIRDMRYALGEYATTTEIRNAPGNVALDNGVVTKNTIDGKFVYEMPNGGMYSIWIRMQDGTNYILPLDMTKFTPTVDTYGVKITVDGLYDAKDFFIAKGQFNSYNEIKNNGYIVRVTENKMAGKHNYTYTVSDPGMHTVLVRYNDGTEHIFHENLTVDEPVFTTNGLQVTVSNIPDVKVIRTAYGEYYTPGDTKRAEGARNFSNKAVIKDAETYMLQYREEGRVTIIVEYNNGYVKVFHYDVVKKAPTVEQNENSVTFGNLDGLVMIRYAVGEYTTSAEIKRAPGSKVIKPDAIVDGKITVSELTIGETYTFCVQYDDESYYYYTDTFGPRKYFTLSFDDGTTQDLKVIEILKKYNVECITFNINTEGLYGAMWDLTGLGLPGVSHQRFTKEELETGIYDGYDVAVHTRTHSSLKYYDVHPDKIIYEVDGNANDIADITGIKPVGMAWPGGDTEYTNTTIEHILKNTSIRYARGTTSTYNFRLPTQFMKWMPTCSISDRKLLDLADEFINMEADEDSLFYVWGHSFELDAYDLYDEFETLIKLMSENEDIVLVTNTEFYELYKNKIPSVK